MQRRRLTTAEKELIAKIARALPRAAMGSAAVRVEVADEVDADGRVSWTTWVPTDDVLPRA